MLLRVISPQWEVYNGEVQKVVLPTENGLIGIFPGHMNLVTTLTKGTITYLNTNIPISLLDSFQDHTKKLEIEWWIAMIEDDIATIIIE